MDRTADRPDGASRFKRGRTAQASLGDAVCNHTLRDVRVGITDPRQLGISIGPTIIVAFSLDIGGTFTDVVLLGSKRATIALHNIVIPLDLDGVRRAAQSLVHDGVEAIAVGFLHAYRNRRTSRQPAGDPRIPLSLCRLSSGGSAGCAATGRRCRWTCVPMTRRVRAGSRPGARCYPTLEATE